MNTALAILADTYTPLLAILCGFVLKPLFTLKRLFSFIVAFSYVILFAFIEIYFGWWLAMDANFSSHTAIVMVMIFALLQTQLNIGILALASVFAYGYLMTVLDYHSWFDILTTMLVCLPCWLFFAYLNKNK
ncbi:hypothetical protein [Psychromonas algicola]|uniref:hypothetical protein n=1 Tax=Psychromonas algicola TaxID=2555642 RepID=UPI001067C2FC|nr:hypothetical protein [Psychromonas sp. RZ5]TEW44297.1 hypothetical protein E2R67_14995 [Psychromonas sp. RZ5]